MNIDSFHNVCVAGFARSGVSLVKLLLKIGKKVKVTDQKEDKVFSSALINEMRSYGVEFEFGAHTNKFIKDSDIIIVSPGINTEKSPVSRIARQNNIFLTGEVEFASWLTKSKIVAITGTNGKTTTSFLTYNVLKSIRPNVYLAGNIGTPLSEYVLDTKPDDIIVLEISSFQLENIIEFKPYVSCLLNIEPDHLDWYTDFNKYVQAKMNIFRNQSSQDWAVLNKEMPGVHQIAGSVNARLVYFSNELSNSDYSAVYRITHIFGADKLSCMKVISNFKGLPHRLQRVRKIKNAVFINDSKATNPASTVWALKNTKPPIILIAGGRDKNLDYGAIKPYLKKVVKVNLFGEASHKIEKSLGKKIETNIFKSLASAVRDAYFASGDKANILFSPMCSSFDLFSDYEERGNKFIDIVNKLASEIQPSGSK